MDYNELRYQTISALLQAGRPLTLAQLKAAFLVDTDSPHERMLLAVLQELIDSAQVVRGALVPDCDALHYAWRARWESAVQSQTSAVQRDLCSALKAVEEVPPAELSVESPPSTAFYTYIVGREYHPPENKRFLVFLQCSVRRPFSSAPSHAPMRRAIRTATGYDPRTDPACPVHVVVLASKIGPVPYELEDLYPANVRGGGVKHFGQETYERVRPILAERMAQYIQLYAGDYEHITSFTQGRYGEVLGQARDMVLQQADEPGKRRASSRFTILPQSNGPRVTRVKDSRPRQYWSRYWIQLFLEIVSWLSSDEQQQAQTRLQELQVEYQV